MCRINEEMVIDAKKEALVAVAQNLLSMNMSAEDVSKATGLSIEEVQALANKSK